MYKYTLRLKAVHPRQIEIGSFCEHSKWLMYCIEKYNEKSSKSYNKKRIHLLSIQDSYADILLSSDYPLDKSPGRALTFFSRFIITPPEDKMNMYDDFYERLVYYGKLFKIEVRDDGSLQEDVPMTDAKLLKALIDFTLSPRTKMQEQAIKHIKNIVKEALCAKREE